MTDLTHVQAHFDSTKKELGTLPSVLGVGFGAKEIRGQVVGKLAYRVYVREKLLPSLLRRSEAIPAEVHGIATDVIEIATALPLYRTSGETSGLLCPGQAVSNLKAVLDVTQDRNGGSGLGALGFFGAVNGVTNRLEVVLVSNRHVLLAHGARKGDPIYRPQYTYMDGKYEFPRETLRAVAEISNEGFLGNHNYAYPGEGPASYFIDCAAARLCCESGLRYQPRLYSNGTRSGLFPRGIARAHPLDSFAGRGIRVRKIGPATGLTYGRVVDAQAVAASVDGRRHENNILIRADMKERGPDAAFAEDGDSGAVVVDEQNRAVGLLWGKSRRNRSEAFACHIHPVLEYLNVTPISYDPARAAQSPLWV